MKKYLISITAGIAISLLGVSLSSAQEDGPPNFVPLEMQVCNYRDGKNRDDLDESLEEMTDWMEETDSEPYAGWIVEKWITGGTQDFDFLFLNAWPDGSTMGKDITDYVSTAGDAIEAFNDVADCPATVFFGSLNVKEPPEGNTSSDNFVLTVSDCNVMEGRKMQDAVNAIREYSDYRDANGSAGGTYLWFPVLGGGDEEFSFKLVNSYASVQAYGDAYQWNIENASYLMRNDLSEGLLDCDVARSYVGDTIINTITGN
ncbi:MAG: hypothetical protein HKN43_05210 [Rhodothermales bacterium]|nr:hypothetical protein [Rhodothermales bacterium]